MIDHTKKPEIFIEIPEISEDFGFLKSPTPRLIRSNSYTLLNPSPMLLQHIKTLTTKNSTSLEEIPKIKPKLVKQVKPSSVRKNLLNDISKRSPYETKSSGKKAISRKRISSAPTENQLKNILTKVEDEHKSKLNQLLLSQQDEQARLQDNFTKQHSELLKQINHVLIRKSPEGNKSLIDSETGSGSVEIGFDPKRDCSRRLFSPELKSIEDLRRVSFFYDFYYFDFGGPGQL